MGWYLNLRDELLQVTSLFIYLFDPGAVDFIFEVGPPVLLVVVDMAVELWWLKLLSKDRADF